MDLIQDKEYLEIVSYLIVILTPIVTLIYFFVKKGRSLSQNIDNSFSGNWTNEGCINCTEEITHSINLAIDCKQGEIKGVLNVRKLNENTEWNFLSVLGKRFYKSVKIRIIHVKKGEVITIAQVKLHLKKNNYLDWKISKTTSDFFPMKTQLWTSDS